MAEVNNINVFIDTTVKDDGQYNHTMPLTFPSGYIGVGDTDNQGLRINLVAFSCINSFNNTNQYNSTFRVVKTNLNDSVLQVIKFDIPYGNYNVYTFRDYINSVCSTYFTISYNAISNSYSILRTLVDSTVKIKINMDSAGVFFGIPNGTLVTLSNITAYNTSFVNMTGWNKIIMRVKGVQFKDPAIDNVNASKFEESEILFWMSRMDKYPFCELAYNDEDNGDLFNYKIHNRQVQNIVISFTDEYNNVITDMPDWKAVIQFEKYEKSNDEQNRLLRSIDIWMRLINTWFLMVLEHLKII